MLSALLKHGLMTMSLKQIQITKEFIMKEKLTKEVEFLCILGMASPINI